MLASRIPPPPTEEAYKKGSGSKPNMGGVRRQGLNEGSCALGSIPRCPLPPHRCCPTADRAASCFTAATEKRKRNKTMASRPAGSRQEFLLGWEDLSMFVDWREGKTEDGRKGSKIEGVERIKRQRGRGFFLVGKKKKKVN